MACYGWFRHNVLFDPQDSSLLCVFIIRTFHFMNNPIIIYVISLLCHHSNVPSILILIVAVLCTVTVYVNNDDIVLILHDLTSKTYFILFICNNEYCFHFICMPCNCHAHNRYIPQSLYCDTYTYSYVMYIHWTYQIQLRYT